MDYLALYSAKCKKCSHLDPEASTAYTNCHTSAGNTMCPASEVQFAVVGEAKRFAEAVRKSRRNGDIKEEVRILQEVAKRPLPFQHKFKEWSSK